MKKTIFVILFLVLAVSIAAYGVKAFTLSDVEFGSSDQDREQTVTGNLVVTNNNSVPITVSLSSTLGSNYQLVFSRTSVQVPANQNTPVSITIYVPKTQLSGRQNIGAITGTDNNGNTVSSSIYLTVKNELEITRVRTDIDGKSTSLSDGDDVKAKPGDDVTLEVTARNDNTDNVDIQDITVDVSSDSDLDWDDNQDLNDLSNGDKDTASFSFTVPNDIDTGDNDVDITVKGRDENGVRYEAKETITIKVERPSHEIKINKLTLEPSTVTCGGRVTLRTTLENTGSHDEDQVAVLIQNNDLKLNQYTERLNINQGDTTDRTYTFNIPNTTAAGEYIIDLSTYYDSDVQSDEQVSSLTVQPCTTPTTPTTPTAPTTPTTPSVPTTPTQPPVIAPSGNVVGPSYGASSFWNSDAYLVVLIAAVVIIILLILVLLVKFVF